MVPEALYCVLPSRFFPPQVATELALQGPFLGYEFSTHLLSTLLFSVSTLFSRQSFSNSFL